MEIKRWLKQRKVNKAFYENQKALKKNKRTVTKSSAKKSKSEMYTIPGVDEIIEKK